MGRLRKGARFWRDPEARKVARRVMVGCQGTFFAIDPKAIFGRVAPLEIELGAGKGEFIIDRARSHPEHDFLAVELSVAVARLLAVRCGRADLANLRVVRMDGRSLVNLMLPDLSVSAYHIYFPDPWPKPRHLKHRLFTPGFVRGIARTLEPRGVAYVATDMRGYAEEICAMFEAEGFTRVDVEVPGASSTGFARKYLGAGRSVRSGAFALAGGQPAPKGIARET